MGRPLNFVVIIEATETTIDDFRRRAAMAARDDDEAWRWEWLAGGQAEFGFETEDQAAIFGMLNKLRKR